MQQFWWISITFSLCSGWTTHPIAKMSAEVNRKSCPRNIKVELSAPEHHNAQCRRQTDKWTIPCQQLTVLPVPNRNHDFCSSMIGYAVQLAKNESLDLISLFVFLFKLSIQNHNLTITATDNWQHCFKNHRQFSSLKMPNAYMIFQPNDNIRVPTLLLKKIQDFSRTFQDPRGAGIAELRWLANFTALCQLYWPTISTSLTLTLYNKLHPH